MPKTDLAHQLARDGGADTASVQQARAAVSCPRDVNIIGAAGDRPPQLSKSLSLEAAHTGRT
jgi:hypothetical protein